MLLTYLYQARDGLHWEMNFFGDLQALWRHLGKSEQQAVLLVLRAVKLKTAGWLVNLGLVSSTVLLHIVK